MLIFGGNRGALLGSLPRSCLSQTPEVCGHCLLALFATPGWERQNQEQGTLRFRNYRASMPKPLYKNSAKQESEDPVTRESNQ